MHPAGMGRYNTPAMYILSSTYLLYLEYQASVKVKLDEVRKYDYE